MLAQNPIDAGSPARLAPKGFDAGDYVYISGQGPHRPAGAASDFPAQVRQCLDNIRKIVETAGLSMDHVVYFQV
jgi:2-iminobutanoate/2-iminopropanoate deaminase